MAEKVTGDAPGSEHLDRGIQRAVDCYRANVRYGGRRSWKKFPLETPLSEIRLWRAARLLELKARFVSHGAGRLAKARTTHEPRGMSMDEHDGDDPLEMWLLEVVRSIQRVDTLMLLQRILSNEIQHRAGIAEPEASAVIADPPPSSD